MNCHLSINCLVNNQRKLKIMENKEIIIIALVVIAIYLYVSYYRHLDSDTKLLTQAEEKIVELRNQVQHYQSLYQKRVEKDLDAETLNSD